MTCYLSMPQQSQKGHVAEQEQSPPAVVVGGESAQVQVRTALPPMAPSACKPHCWRGASLMTSASHIAQELPSVRRGGC
jgi:hypothetical protein